MCGVGWQAHGKMSSAIRNLRKELDRKCTWKHQLEKTRGVMTMPSPRWCHIIYINCIPACCWCCFHKKYGWNGVCTQGALLFLTCAEKIPRRHIHTWECMDACKSHFLPGDARILLCLMQSRALLHVYSAFIFWNLKWACSPLLTEFRSVKLP